MKVHDIETELVDNDQNILKNEIKYQKQNDEEYFGFLATAYEDLNKTDRTKYEYVLPNVVYERNLISSEKLGIVDLYTNAIAKNYNVNQTTKFLVNNVGWKSKSFNNAAGIQTNFEGLLKVVTYDAENTDEYKNEDAIKAYRKYYYEDKNHIWNWKHRETPEWIMNLMWQ